MKFNGIEIISPQLFPQQPFNETETLGALMWLWANAPHYAAAGVREAVVHVLPTLKNGQFALLCRNSEPIAYCCWAYFNEQTEQQYLQSDQVLRQPENWHSGERMWLINWFAPFGDSRLAKHILLKQFLHSPLFKDKTFCYLHHRGGERCRRILCFDGKNLVRQ